MIRLKNIQFFASFLFLLASCSNTQLDNEIEIINQSFLHVADTVAYQEFSLRPAPPQFGKEVKTKPVPGNLAIVVPDTLYSLNNWEAELTWLCGESTLLKEDPSNEIVQILCNKMQKQKMFKISKLTNTGRYNLINAKASENSDLIVVGKIIFSRVALNKNNSLAAFIATISTGEKSGITKLFLLSNSKGRWIIDRTENLLVW